MTEIRFPASHPMARWETSRTDAKYLGKIVYLGKLGDTVDFAALEPSLQTKEMAARVGYAWWAVQFDPDGGHFNFVWSPARTTHPNRTYVW